LDCITPVRFSVGGADKGATECSDKYRGRTGAEWARVEWNYSGMDGV